MTCRIISHTSYIIHYPPTRRKCPWVHLPARDMVRGHEAKHVMIFQEPPETRSCPGADTVCIRFSRYIGCDGG